MDERYKQPLLAYNAVYHIYNCGINGGDIFHSEEDYNRFLQKVNKYILPIADMYAWCLLSNHFHFLLKIKKEDTIISMKEAGIFDYKKKNKDMEDKPLDITNQFSHLFNSHAQYYNNKYKRHGSLLEHTFKRTKIENREDFKRCLIYIHQNSLKHKLANDIRDYPYTSFGQYFSETSSNIKKKTALKLFDGLADFEKSHESLVVLA